MSICSKMNDLQKEAERRYIENSEWNFIFECLEPEEQKEYKQLYKEFYGKEYKE